MRRILACALALTALTAGEGIYQPPSPEPTAEETFALELMNRLRADPVGETERILGAPKSDITWCLDGVDVAMFRSEMAVLKPVPPVVFNLDLLLAARRHSFYMVHNGLTHDESPDKTGYTGNSFSDRAKAAGYRGGPGGENCYAAAANPTNSHIGFVVDAGKGGPGGMQPARGHRRNMMDAGFTEVGLSAVPNGQRLSVTHVFGRGERCAGGVVFVDRNRNGVYDIGEGRGGVTITCGKATVRSWSSGAYTLPLGGGGTVTFTADGQTFTQAAPPSGGNLHINWVIPQQVELDAADKLIASADKAIVADKAGADSPVARKARIALAIGIEGMALDQARNARIAGLVGDLPTQIAAVRRTVGEAVAAGGKDAAKTIAEAGKTWRGTALDGLLSEAGKALQIRQGHLGYLAGRGQKTPPTQVRTMAKELEKARDSFHEPAFIAVVDAYLADVKQDLAKLEQPR
jgi:hypothetical protein